jgi:acetyl/propionyl-CoA carboxylase alpha subunit
VSRKVFLWRREPQRPEPLVLDGRAGQWTVSCAGSTLLAEIVALPDGRISVLLSDGRQLTGRVARRGRGDVGVSTPRGAVRFGLADPLHDRLDHLPAAGGSSDSNEEIRALMPGRVVEVAVAPGDRVEKGTLLLVLEAMKMQNEIRASRGGIVERAEVSAGQVVESGDLMLTVLVEHAGL